MTAPQMVAVSVAAVTVVAIALVTIGVGLVFSLGWSLIAAGTLTAPAALFAGYMLLRDSK